MGGWGTCTRGYPPPTRPGRHRTQLPHTAPRRRTGLWAQPGCLAGRAVHGNTREHREYREYTGNTREYREYTVIHGYTGIHGEYTGIPGIPEHTGNTREYREYPYNREYTGIHGNTGITGNTREYTGIPGNTGLIRPTALRASLVLNKANGPTGLSSTK